MTQADQGFKPLDAIDLKDQSTAFLALEELGIAYIQNTWIQANQPDHKDAQALKEQAGEFLADIIDLFSGHVPDGRLAGNQWAGAAMAAHLKSALTGRLDPAGDDRETIARAMDLYLADLDVLCREDQRLARAGEKMTPHEYIQLMTAWSGVFSGQAAALTYTDAFTGYRAAHQ